MRQVTQALKVFGLDVFRIGMMNFYTALLILMEDHCKIIGDYCTQLLSVHGLVVLLIFQLPQRF